MRQPLLDRLAPRAHREIRTTLVFACRACGFSGEVTSVGEGRATVHAQESHEPRPPDPAEIAESRALRDALAAASVAHCPRCGRRDGRRVLALALSRALSSIGVGLVLGFVALLGSTTLALALRASRMLGPPQLARVLVVAIVGSILVVLGAAAVRIARDVARVLRRSREVVPVRAPIAYRE
ncbi:MAG: hypothetical protein M3Y87_32745 [Myxococcota bacterium]|nr:hypothetical protein [Myxococcota bacterium]